VASAFAKENFRVTPAVGVTLNQALAACYSSSLCTNTDGCCNGHGYCSVSTGLVASCECDSLPSECHGASTYNSTTKCATIPTSAVCCDGNDVDFLASGNCHHIDFAYPERGAKGTLLRRVGDQDRYNHTVNFNDIRTEDITAMANDLMSSARLDNTVHTWGNMMGLGLLEVATKDIVHYAYFDVSEKNVTFDGKTWPALKWQQNTGINGTGFSIPKQFENTATSVIDLGPLYDFAPRINGGVYVDINAALNYWNLTHHMPREFLVALRFYARYHYYMARSIEEFLFGGQNSTVSEPTRTSTLGNFTVAKDVIFEQARRSTIRASQAFLEQMVLPILYDNQFDTDGWHHTFFDQYFRKDELQTRMEVGAIYSIMPLPSIRQNQEFAGDMTRNLFREYSVSGLDFLISLRNDAWDTSSYSKLQEVTCEGIAPADPTLTWEVLSLSHTQLARYGAKVRSVYSADLKLNLWRAAELGLGDYALHVSQLTNVKNGVNPPSTADLDAAAKADNVLYRSMKETNSTRQYRSRTSSIAFAALVPINDILIVDRTSYWARDALGVPTSYLYHSKIFITPDDGTSFYTYCYKVGGVCTDASTDAGATIFATHPHLNDYWEPLGFGAEENQFIWRSRGGLFSSPPTLPTPQDSVGTWIDADPRRCAQNQLVPEFVNPLYYHYDGPNTMAVKQSGSDIRYLPNQIIDAFPTNIAWTSAYDGFCYTSDYINSESCSRASTNFWTFTCVWDWPY
jgi:hypothetical protein